MKSIDELTNDIITSLPSVLRTLSLKLIHTALVYIFIRAAITTSSANKKLKKLLFRLPYHLQATLLDPFFNGINFVRNLIEELHEGYDFKFSRVDVLIELLRKHVGRVGSVLIVDCMSLIEFIALKAFLANKKYYARFTDFFFINFSGLTRFMTKQLSYFGTLNDVARLIAENVDASYHHVFRYLDKLVHEPCGMNLITFLEKLPLDEICCQIERMVSMYDSVLVTSDHGYNILWKNDFLYVDHGISSGIVKLNNLAFFMIIGRR